MSNFVIVILCYFFFVPVALALELDKCAETNSSDHDCEPSLVVEKATWFDDSRNYVGTSADDLAIWIDTFFSEPRSDIESAKSSLRLTYENQLKHVFFLDIALHFKRSYYKLIIYSMHWYLPVFW